MNPERPQNKSHGKGSQGKSNNRNNNSSDGREVAISKQLSYFLRHGAEKEGLKITQDGWILVADILQHKNMKNKGATVEEIEVSRYACVVSHSQAIVHNNDKQRFALKTEDTGLWIRANQGHSLAVCFFRFIFVFLDPFFVF
jgi:2'-phosphotransferase